MVKKGRPWRHSVLKIGSNILETITHFNLTSYYSYYFWQGCILSAYFNAGKVLVRPLSYLIML